MSSTRRNLRAEGGAKGEAAEGTEKPVFRHPGRRGIPGGLPWKHGALSVPKVPATGKPPCPRHEAA